jgi:hypothetical protein
MVENVAIRVLVGIVIIALGFMVLKFFEEDKKQGKPRTTEYKIPETRNRKKEVRSRLNLPKGILKREGAPSTSNHVSFAPSAIDATISEYGAWDTNRNSSSGIMNNLNSVDALTSGNMAPTVPAPVSYSVNQLPMVPMVGFSDDDYMFGSEL